MLDAFWPRKISKFSGELEKYSIAPQDIILTILTHCHFDHAGS